MESKLEEAILKNELIIFVGAGVSIPFGFPNWTNLVIDILKELNEEDTKGLDLDYHIRKGKDLDVFEVLDDLERKKFKSKVKKLLYNKIKEVEIEGKDFTKIEKLWRISDKIITTNYDGVLEKKKPNNIDAFPNFNEFQQAKSLNGNPFLYKIHGDIINPDGCVLFNSDYESLYKNTSSDLNTLKTFVSTKTILFIGFSFDDKFIQKQFSYINELYKGYNKEHFIVLTKDKNLSEFNLETIKIDNWEDGYNSFLDKLLELKQKKDIESNEDVEIDILSVNDIDYLLKLLEEKKQELEKADDLEKRNISKEIHRISNRVQELVFKRVDFKSDIIQHKEAEVEFVFEEIFKEEKLSKSILRNIYEIRDLHSEKYKWYHRSVLVSALACSLVNHRKVDSKKIDLLIDFTGDTEDKVWQKAITYLFIVLNHLGNKWIRFSNLKPKLESLKSQDRIQEALNQIITLLQMNFHNTFVFADKIFDNEYFKDSPFNYFLPFYENNPSVEKVYEDDLIEEVEEYVDFLYENPFPDSFKYLICNTKRNSKSISNSGNEFDEKRKKELSELFNIHLAFNPYLNYVNDFFSFYKYFPSTIKGVKDKTDIVIFNKLKNYLLSQVEYHRAIGRSFVLDKNYGKAITHFKSLINLKDTDEEALVNLASCYSYVKNKDEELNTRFKIEEINPKEEENLYLISAILHSKNRNEEALTYIDKLIKINSNKYVSYYLRGNIKVELKDYEEAIKDFDKSIELDDSKCRAYIQRAFSKNNLKDLEGALEDCELALKRCNDKENEFRTLHMKTILLREKKLFKEGLRIIEEILSKLKVFLTSNVEHLGRTYGTKAVLYLDLGDEEMFYEFLEESFKNKAKAEWLLEDVKAKYIEEKRFKELLKKYNQII
ncbi:SIR2 family protein [Tenacibaculum discolor]|uniref:SIR2 family protein n=1 Tax=Tenacibaculum discolor TaxID=361581 RepID=UPI000EB3C510|nr:SIR2 family protein [Tenacibaculum discolor]RLK03330.1 tetratricopeptide repeat protein [Tenacibaculum discolor]